MEGWLIALLVLLGIVVVFVVVMLCLMPCKCYFTALFSGCYISAFKCISMKMRKLDVNEIVKAYVLSKKSHQGLTLYDLQIVQSCGGHPMKIVEGLNAAKTATLDLDFEFCKSVDISGFDILEVVRECINPKVIELPLISSVAQDNIEVNVKISITLKVNIKNFLRGVTDETVSARSVEAVVTKIANTMRASDLVAKPQLLDKAIFDAGVDDDSKYELVSADVIHADLGNNRGLSAEKESIEKEQIIAANQLERRRLIAVAQEQEMKARAEEMRAKAIENEAEVPKAIIKAIEEGKIKDVVDYYKLQNLQADTEMRRQIVAKKQQNDSF